jgi:glutathione S-transferase
MAEGGFDIDSWLHLAAWAGRLKAMPDFALPYDLIPSDAVEIGLHVAIRTGERWSNI